MQLTSKLKSTTIASSLFCKGPCKREDTLLPTQMFPRLPARATFVADTNFVSGTQKMFLVLVRNSLCPQQMFPSLRSPKNIRGNNVSSFIRALRPCLHYAVGIWKRPFSLTFSVHTTPEKFEKTQRSLVILDLCLRKTGAEKSHDSHYVIVFA